MVSFIKQEAEEKANEISVSAEEVWALDHLKSQMPLSDCTSLANGDHPLLLAQQDFNIEKLQLLESEKAKIRKEYERREGQIEVKKKM